MTNEPAGIIRVGKVTEFDEKTLRARVEFSDLGIVSHWLPVLVTNTKLTKDSIYLDEGEHVVCLMLGTGVEAGFIAGAFYDDKNPPVIQDKDKRTVNFDDETSITYDRASHVLSIDCVNEIVINATNHIKLTAGRIDLN